AVAAAEVDDAGSLAQLEQVHHAGHLAFGAGGVELGLVEEEVVLVEELAPPLAQASRPRSRDSFSRSSLRGTMASIMPCCSRNSLRWNPSGSFCRKVCSMTRGPAKPMSAPGSARMTSPWKAKEAATPPVVGSSSTLM